MSQPSAADSLARLHDLHRRFRAEVLPRIADLHRVIDTNPLLYPVRGILHERLSAGEQRLATIDRQLTELGVILPAPDAMRTAAGHWVQVRHELSDVAGSLAAPNIEIKLSWQGRAAEIYDTAVRPAQVAAIERLTGLADTFQRALMWAARAGDIFAGAAIAVALGVVGALLLAIAAALPLAFGAAAAATGAVRLATLAAMGVNALAGVIISFRDTFAQVEIWLAEIRSQLHDHTAFPGGRWPDARTEAFADATVTDGDADWSVVPG
jgi:hypothetical protein